MEAEAFARRLVEAYMVNWSAQPHPDSKAGQQFQDVSDQLVKAIAESIRQLVNKNSLQIRDRTLEEAALVAWVTGRESHQRRNTEASGELAAMRIRALKTEETDGPGRP